MSVRRAVLLSSTALVGALLVPGAATAAAAPTSASLLAAYTCAVNSPLVPKAEPFPMAVEAQVAAVRTGPAVKVEMSLGKPVIPLDEPLEDVGLSSVLLADVNGAATTLASNGTVSFLPGIPVDLPVLTSTVTTPATSLRIAPGALTITVSVSIFKVPINCTLDAPVSIAVPVTDPTAPVPTPKPPAPRAEPAPVLKVSLSKKTQKYRKAPIKVKVSLKRAKRSTVTPQGTVTVKVGKRTVSRVKVKGSKSFRVTLSRKLKIGRHQVKVTFTPKKGTVHKPVRRSVSVRVKR